MRGVGRPERTKSSRMMKRCAALIVTSVAALGSVVATVRAEEGKAPAKPAVAKAKETSAYSGILEGDPRGVADLTVCSQNLKLFGNLSAVSKKNAKYTAKVHEAKIEDLAERFASVKCDVIALQEIISKDEADGEQALKPLIERLKVITSRRYTARVGPPAEGGMGLGFLIAEDRATIVNTLAYARVELPKLVAKQRPRMFSRTPLELQLSVKSRHDDQVKIVSIINFHMKSKRGGEGDPTGLEWETYRMEMAEAFRRILEVRHRQSFASSQSILVVLGDRNSNFDVASARILEGSLRLSDFQMGGGCRLSKRGFPACQVGVEKPRRLFSVLTGNRDVFALPGTFSYKGEYSWLDDILMPAESLPFAWQNPTEDGRYASGVVYEPKGASDHAMVWMKLNW